MNKRRRYLAKRRRRWFGGARAPQVVPMPYETCRRCGDYILACTCWEQDEARADAESFRSGTRYPGQ